MKLKFAYCPVCMFREFIAPKKEAKDYVCPRHGVRCIYSDEKTDLEWLG